MILQLFSSLLILFCFSPGASFASANEKKSHPLCSDALQTHTTTLHIRPLILRIHKQLNTFFSTRIPSITPLFLVPEWASKSTASKASDSRGLPKISRSRIPKNLFIDFEQYSHALATANHLDIETIEPWEWRGFDTSSWTALMQAAENLEPGNGVSIQLATGIAYDGQTGLFSLYAGSFELFHDPEMGGFYYLFTSASGEKVRIDDTHMFGFLIFKD